MSAAGETPTVEVADRYFAAVAAHDLNAMCACWAPGGIDRLVGQADLVAPDGVRDWFSALFAAFPDLRFDVVARTAQDERCAVRWTAHGTFAGPGSFEGLEPNGAHVEFEGCDVVRVADGRIVHNDAYFDGVTLARQLGLIPPAGSAAERGMTEALNACGRLGRRLAAREPERIADGVWLVRGGLPTKTMNVYLVEHRGRVTVFDAGVQSMTRAVAAAAARLGGIERVVLGHGHADHRGAAPGLEAPVHCHADETADVAGDAGVHYFHYERLDIPARWVMPSLIRYWDGGPVEVAGTVAEGEEVAGFEVVHLPGHAPGLIGLWRAADRLALASDCFYTLDPQTGIKGGPRVAHPAFNLDTDQARESMRKLAALEPATAWAGHADPLIGDVRGQLERAAAAG